MGDANGYRRPLVGMERAGGRDDPPGQPPITLHRQVSSRTSFSIHPATTSSLAFGLKSSKNFEKLSVANPNSRGMWGCDLMGDDDQRRRRVGPDDDLNG
jgi:hypothetical protein